MTYNLCFIKPNKKAYSETFVQLHIDGLAGNKKVMYGGSFPVYTEDGHFLIRSIPGLISYLIQKRIFKKNDIAVRTKALTAYLKKNKIDVVFCEYGTVGASVLDACAAAAVPMVVHFHGTDAYHHPTLAAYKERYAKMFAYANYFIAVSVDMRRQLEKLGAPEEKIIWNPCGVNTSVFDALDIRSSKPHYLSIGRFVYKKSPLSTIQAFKKVADVLPDAHLWMVGEGPLWQESKDLAVSLGLQEKITFTGVLSTPEILSLRKNMRCFVQHSVTAPNGDMEGTPVSVLEAAASALPVVSTKHAGIQEAVIDGKTGYLVEEFDTDAMAEKMIALGSSVELAIAFGKAGRAHMMAQYRIEDKIKILDSAVQKSVQESRAHKIHSK